MIKLRNDVIHKGLLASKDEALAFGNAVLEVINPTLRLLKTRDNDLLQTMVMEHMKGAISAYGMAVPSTMCLPTILSISRDISIADPTDIHNWSPAKY